MKKTDLPETFKVMPTADVLKSFKSASANGTKPVSMSLAEIEKKIAELEKEAEIALAIETFLDCNPEKVKVSKRVPKSPKYALGSIR
jgi:hypothetical protein